MSIECIHCSEDNDEQATQCKNCGSKLPTNPSREELHTSTETLSKCAKGNNIDNQKQPAKRESRNEPRLILSLVGQTVDIEISQCGGSIGRCGDIEPDFFANHQYLSRDHCQIYYDNGLWKEIGRAHV